MNKYNFVQIGFFVNTDDFDKHTKNDANPQTAARKLEGRYINGFRKNSLHLTLLSFFPSTNFPGNPKIFFGYNRTIINGIINYSYPFINFIGAKHVTRFFSCLVFLSIWHFKNRNQIKKIIIYSVHSPFLLAALIFKVLFNTSTHVIVPDLPRHMNFGGSRSIMWRFLKKIDSRFLDFLISKTSGISVVTRNMAAENVEWSNLPYMVIEGMVDEDSRAIEKKSVDKKIFFYAGGLNAEYGVQSLLTAFQELFQIRDDIELWLCGKGELVADIQALGKKHRGLKYFGYLSQSEIDKLMGDVFCLVNCRNPNDSFVKYSFPSKLLEYLVSGIPILTTKLPGVPDEYDKYLNYIDGSDAIYIVHSVVKIMQEDEEYLREKANAGRDFVINNKNSKIQTSKFLNLIMDEGDINV